MTATDELRRLLDERGIEYYPERADETVWTASNNVAHVWTCNDLIDGYLEIHVRPITPEQAIEATLGRGTCRMEPFIYEDTGAFIECSECGWQLFDADYSIDAAREWLGYCPCCGRWVVDA